MKWQFGNTLNYIKNKIRGTYEKDYRLVNSMGNGGAILDVLNGNFEIEGLGSLLNKRRNDYETFIQNKYWKKLKHI